MNAQEFLLNLEAIPHLLELARQQDELRRYPVQNTLRRQYREQGRPFLYSMPMRHQYRCPLCEEQKTDILHELEDPRSGAKMEFPQLVLHQAQSHDAPPAEELASFLLECLQETE